MIVPQVYFEFDFHSNVFETPIKSNCDGAWIKPKEFSKMLDSSAENRGWTPFNCVPDKDMIKNYVLNHPNTPFFIGDIEYWPATADEAMTPKFKLLWPDVEPVEYQIASDKWYTEFMVYLKNYASDKLYSFWAKPPLPRSKGNITTDQLARHNLMKPIYRLSNFACAELNLYFEINTLEIMNRNQRFQSYFRSFYSNELPLMVHIEPIFPFGSKTSVLRLWTPEEMEATIQSLDCDMLYIRLPIPQQNESKARVEIDKMTEWYQNFMEIFNRVWGV